MGLWTRFKLIFATKASSAMDRAEDPRQVLDYAYTQQQQLLVKLRQGLVEVATSKQQLERQSKKLGTRVPQLDDQARRALERAATIWRASPSSESAARSPSWRRSTRRSPRQRRGEAARRPGALAPASNRGVPQPPRCRFRPLQRRRSGGQGQRSALRRLGRAGRAGNGGGTR